MNEQECHDVLVRLINVNGPVPQLMKCSEAFSTLSAECAKIAVEGTINTEKLAEELADVEINLNILEMLILSSKGTQAFNQLKKDYFDFKMKKFKNTVEMMEKLLEEQQLKQADQMRVERRTEEEN